MPFKIIRADITTLDVDAIVNAANSSLLGGGGVDGAIHRAAGPRLYEECRTLGGCKTGEAKITKGYDLKAKYVIHTVGPVYSGGNNGERGLLSSCYRNSLELAKENGLRSVAFPLISSGAYGYPKAEAIEVARREITAFLDKNEDFDIILTVYDKSSFELGKTLARDIEEYIKENEVRYEPRRTDNARPCESVPLPGVMQTEKAAEKNSFLHALRPKKTTPAGSKEPKFGYAAQSCETELSVKPSLSDMLERLDESFSTSLLRMIDEKGLKDSEVYKRANIDRKLFSKIRSDPAYRPSKPTVIALAIALQLDLDDTAALLKKAGFALSRSSKADVIIEYFIVNKKYDVFEINEALFAYDQALLGA